MPTISFYAESTTRVATPEAAPLTAEPAGFFDDLTPETPPVTLHPDLQKYAEARPLSENDTPDRLIDSVIRYLGRAPLALQAALRGVRERIRVTATAEEPASSTLTVQEEPAVTVELAPPLVEEAVTKDKTHPAVIEYALERMWDANRNHTQPVFTKEDQARLEGEFAARLETVPVQPLGLRDRFKGWLGRVTSYRISEPAWTRTFITTQPNGRWALDRAKIQGLSDDQLRQQFSAAEQYVARAQRQEAHHQMATLPVGAWERNVYAELTKAMIMRGLVPA